MKGVVAALEDLNKEQREGGQSQRGGTHKSRKLLKLEILKEKGYLKPLGEHHSLFIQTRVRSKGLDKFILFT